MPLYQITWCGDQILLKSQQGRHNSDNITKINEMKSLISFTFELSLCVCVCKGAGNKLCLVLFQVFPSSNTIKWLFIKLSHLAVYFIAHWTDSDCKWAWDLFTLGWFLFSCWTLPSLTKWSLWWGKRYPVKNSPDIKSPDKKSTWMKLRKMSLKMSAVFDAGPVFTYFVDAVYYDLFSVGFFTSYIISFRNPLIEYIFMSHVNVFICAVYL